MTTLIVNKIRLNLNLKLLFLFFMQYYERFRNKKSSVTRSGKTQHSIRLTKMDDDSNALRKSRAVTIFLIFSVW
jgi:hypothetical protein